MLKTLNLLKDLLMSVDMIERDEMGDGSIFNRTIDLFRLNSKIPFKFKNLMKLIKSS